MNNKKADHSKHKLKYNINVEISYQTKQQTNKQSKFEIFIMTQKLFHNILYSI